MLGAILARHGLKVLLLDSEAHPRFAIGEATTPDTNLRLKLLSVKYDVPEIDHLSAFEPLRDNVSPACGVKRAFSFLYHRDGQEQQPLESQQYPTLAPPMGADCHFFRQDTDAYMLAVALNYGARVRQQTRGGRDRPRRRRGRRDHPEGRDASRPRTWSTPPACARCCAGKLGLREDPAALPHQLARDLHPHGGRQALRPGGRAAAASTASSTRSRRARCTTSSTAAGSG